MDRYIVWIGLLGWIRLGWVEFQCLSMRWEGRDDRVIDRTLCDMVIILYG